MWRHVWAWTPCGARNISTDWYQLSCKTIPNFAQLWLICYTETLDKYGPELLTDKTVSMVIKHCYKNTAQLRFKVEYDTWEL